MKTLDEVINDYEICLKASLNINSCVGCSYFTKDNPQCRSFVSADVLHYLKEYRDYRNQTDTEIKSSNVPDAEYRNPPLSWDELKQMVGKPVWVEDDGDQQHWDVIERIGNSNLFDGHFVETHKSILRKKDMGKTWQAYRKERHDADEAGTVSG